MDVKIPEIVIEKASNADRILFDAKHVVIKDNDQYVFYADELKKIKSKYKELETDFKEMKKPAEETKKRISDYFKKPLGILLEAEKIIKTSMLDYQKEEERKRAELERKLREKTRREEEKKRLALEKRAQKAQEKGMLDRAEEIRNEKEDIYIVPPTIQKQTPKIAGQHVCIQWKARVIDIANVPREYLIVNQKALDGVARGTKGTLKIEGVEFYATETLVART